MGVIVADGRFREHVRAHISGHLVLQLGDLVEERGDDVLGEVIRLLLCEPGEVLILQLQVIELLVEVVEGLRVALLVDEALTLGQGALKLRLARSQLLNAVNLLLLLEVGLLFLANPLLLLLCLGFNDAGFPVFKLIINHLELTLPFLVHCTVQHDQTLLVLFLHLVHEVLRVDFEGIISSCHVVDVLAACLFLDQLALEVTKSVKLSLLLGHALL